jgi:hypothetical protein
VKRVGDESGMEILYGCKVTFSTISFASQTHVDIGSVGYGKLLRVKNKISQLTKCHSGFNLFTMK